MVGLAIQLKAMFEKFGFTSKVLCYMKLEGTNLASMTPTFKSMISCEAFSVCLVILMDHVFDML